MLCCPGAKTAAAGLGCATSRPFHRVAAGAGPGLLQALAWAAAAGAPPTPVEGKEEIRQKQATCTTCTIAQGHCPLCLTHSHCLPVTSLAPFFPLNTGYSPHKGEDLFKTLMTPLQLVPNGPVIFHHTWKKVSIPQRSSRMGPTVASVRPPQLPTA